jgi:hypothetical protein
MKNLKLGSKIFLSIFQYGHVTRVPVTVISIQHKIFTVEYQTPDIWFVVTLLIKFYDEILNEVVLTLK